MTALAGGAIGAALFLLVLGADIVRPSNLGWTMRHDLQTYVLAWTHFRHEPWQWPPGAVIGIGHPVGTSVGNTDAVPLVAFALKPLSPLLPEPMQFLGAWLLLCWVLQGVFGVWLVRQATSDRRLQLLGAALFVQVPALFSRTGHPALAAHWVLLAALVLLIDGQRGHRRWHPGAWLALAAVVAAVQPYLAAMVLALAGAGVVTRARSEASFSRALGRLVAEGGAIVAVTAVTFWIGGYFQVGSVAALEFEGVGRFSMNLLGPITPMGFSMLLPEQPLAMPGQYEGHVYFGAGWLLVCAVALGLAVVRRDAVAGPRLGLGWVAAAACAVVALSPVVTVGASTLADLRTWAPDSLAVFRSSGRFGWVGMYAVFAVAIGAVVTRLATPAALAVLAGAMLLQGVDLSGAYRAIRARQIDPAWTTYHTPIPSAAWPVIVGAHRHLVMAPPDMCAAVWAPPAGPHLPFSLLAGTSGVTINSGNAGRYDEAAILRYCAVAEADLRAGRIDAETVYVLSPAMRAVITAATTTTLACGTLDGVDVCTPAATWERWRAAAGAAGFTAVAVGPATP